MSEMAYWSDEHDTGPPTDADWDWFVAHVMVVQDRPPAVNRQPAPMTGQAGLFEVGGHVRWVDGTTSEIPTRVVKADSPDEAMDELVREGWMQDDDIPPGWRGEHFTGQD